MRARGLIALAVLAVPACAATPVPAPSLTAEVRQYRSDVPLRRLSVTTTNRSAGVMTVERVQLLARGFVALPSAPVDVRLQPGERVDVPAAYGRPRCGSPLPEGADAARLLVRPRGGPPVEVTVRLSPSGGLLPRLHASECAQARVRAAVSLELAPGWVRRGDGLEGALVVRRRAGDEPVVVQEAGGHIVLTVRGALPATLPSGQSELRVPLTVTPTRCDGHALSQNSRSAVFPFVVRVGDDEPLQTPAVAGAELQAQLQRLATDVCLPGA